MDLMLLCKAKLVLTSMTINSTSMVAIQTDLYTMLKILDILVQQYKEFIRLATTSKISISTHLWSTERPSTETLRTASFWRMIMEMKRLDAPDLD